MNRFYLIIEKWFSAPEQNAAGRMGLYRILFCIWYIWLLTEIDFNAFAMRPSVATDPVGMISLLNDLSLLNETGFSLYWVSLILIASLITLMFGLLTRVSTALVLICGALLFAWDSSFGKVIDKYVLLGSIIPFWMLFSRWGETYSMDAWIRRAVGLPVTKPDNASWLYIWPMRAVLVSISIFYFSAGYMKITGTWLHNPYVVMDKLMGNLIESWVVGGASRWDEILYSMLVHAPFILIIGQYISLAFECLFPVALINRDSRILMCSMAALFHTLTILLLGIGFAPMIIALAIIVDWQKIYERIWPFQQARRAPSKTGLVLLTIVIIVTACAAGHALASGNIDRAWFKLLPNQKIVWFWVAPFAAFALFRSAGNIIRRSDNQAANGQRT